MRALDGYSQPMQLGPLKGLATLGSRWIYNRNDVLLPQTAGTSSAALITSGLVKVTAVSREGHETFLAIRGPRELLGEDAVFRGTQQGRPQDSRRIVTALGRVQARVFHVDELRRFLLKNQAALNLVAQSISDQLAEAEARICSAGRDNADRRLARLLCDLERYGAPPENGSPDATQLPVRLSHQDLANWIGACRETVDRAFHNWRERGFVTTGRMDIVINDRQALGRIAGIQVSPRRPLIASPALTSARARQ